MKFIVDMNLSPKWVEVLVKAGWQAAHWSTVGAPDAADEVLMQWAADNDSIVLTHDLDFGTMLSATQAAKPSVVQVRTQNVLPADIGDLLVTELKAHEAELLSGALLVIDRARLRVRILPLIR
ncbi:MAG: DUF5615 family PIN-like protein [Aureliella sp.]